MFEGVNMTEAATGAIGVIVGAMVVLFGQLAVTYITNRHEESRERREYLRTVAQILAELRGEIQWAQGPLTFLPGAKEKYLDIETEKKAFERLQIALGKATGIMLTVDDKRVQNLGLSLMNTTEPKLQNDRIEEALQLLAPYLSKKAASELDGRFST